MYDIEGEYYTYQNMVLEPNIFVIKKWLTLYDVYKLKLFRRYYFSEFGDYFFINKISGFNPIKSLTSTELELIKIK